jgi:AcrR family transcriptional regulator
MAAPARSNARGAVTRARILAAAVDCLTEGGIDDVRIAKVAERAATSSASVHYHFATRETLLAEAIEESFAVAGDVRTTTKYGAGGARERLRRKVEESLPLDRRRRREWELWVELWLRAVREPELRATSAKVYRQLHRALRELLEEGVADGEFAVADPGAAAERILAAIDGYGRRALLADPTVTPEHALARVWEQVEAELG